MRKKTLKRRRDGSSLTCIVGVFATCFGNRKSERHIKKPEDRCDIPSHKNALRSMSISFLLFGHVLHKTWNSIQVPFSTSKRIYGICFTLKEEASRSLVYRH